MKEFLAMAWVEYRISLNINRSYTFNVWVWLIDSLTLFIIVRLFSFWFQPWMKKTSGLFVWGTHFSRILLKGLEANRFNQPTSTNCHSSLTSVNEIEITGSNHARLQRIILTCWQERRGKIQTTTRMTWNWLRRTRALNLLDGQKTYDFWSQIPNFNWIHWIYT